jgi:very-short-patch-repair endonuclease
LLDDGLSPRALQWGVRRQRIVHLSRDAYLPGGEPLDLLDRIRALLAVLPPDCLVGYHTAAALHGFGVLPTTHLHVVVPAGTPVPQRRGVAAHATVLPIDDPVMVLGVPCVPAARCAIDLARTVRRIDALPVLDAALRAGACDVDALVVEVARHDALRGVRQARELTPLATPLAECRQESQLRLVLHDGRLPAPQAQFRVFNEYGVERWRIDLAHEAEQVGTEFDGSSHLDRWRMRTDRYRHNWLESHGWAMRYFTDADLYRRPDFIVSTVREALSSRRSRTS